MTIKDKWGYTIGERVKRIPITECETPRYGTIQTAKTVSEGFSSVTNIRFYEIKWDDGITDWNMVNSICLL